MNNDRQRYANCMEEIKLRTESIKDILNKNTNTTYKMTDIEFCCLQVRKILELIAMASIVAHKDVYREMHKKFYNHYKVRCIIKDLEVLHPDFYPVPSGQVLRDGKVVEVIEIKEGFLTKEELIDVYEKCSSIIHVSNPYNRNTPNIADIETRIGVWLDKIIKLLNHHQVRLYKSENQIWVLMNGEDDGRVHVFDMRKMK